MISYTVERQVAPGKFYREGSCVSSDTKPVDDSTMANGSLLLEMDTATAYFFDEEAGEWRAWE